MCDKQPQHVHTWCAEINTWTRSLSKAGGQQRPSSNTHNECLCMRIGGGSTMANTHPQSQGPPLAAQAFHGQGELAKARHSLLTFAFDLMRLNPLGSQMCHLCRCKLHTPANTCPIQLQVDTERHVAATKRALMQSRMGFLLGCLFLWPGRGHELLVHSLPPSRSCAS